MAKLYDVRAITGEYEKDGETKKRYTTIGAVLETKNGGMMIKLDVLPTNWEGFAYLNEPLPPKSAGTPQSGSGGDVAPDNVDDEVDLSSIPF